MSKRRQGHSSGLVGLSVAALLLSGCERRSAPEVIAVREAVEVAVVSPQQRELVRTIRVTGTLRGDEEMTVATKVAGRIVAVFKDFGDAAAPGEHLARVDPVDYELARDERARAFAQALAKLGLTELPSPGFDVDALPTVERARLQAENAKARHDRGALLANRTPPSISQQDFADLRTTWDVAESNVRVERLTVEAGVAEARTLEAQVQIAAQRVEDTLHRAPAPEPAPEAAGTAGESQYRVAQRFVSVGDFVPIGAPLFRLVDQDPVKLRAGVPERRLGAIQVGQRASVAIEAYATTFQGSVSRVSPTVDVATRNFEIEILLANAEGSLKPGSFASAEVAVGTERALVLPETSVVTFSGVHKVVLAVEGRAEERRVALGESTDGFIEIVSGVQETDQVVREPTPSLTTGAALRIAARGEAQ